MIIKSLKLNKKIILIITFFIISLSIILFVSFANNNENNKKENDFIKWVDFNVSYKALDLTAKLDIDSHNKDAPIKYNWIELLSYLACKNGGDFKNFKNQI